MGSWRASLGQAYGRERWFLLGCMERAAREVLEAEVHRRCWADPIGLADCRDVGATCRSLRWRRLNGFTLVECVVTVKPSSRRTVRRYKGHRTPLV